MDIDDNLNKVYCGDAWALLRTMPDGRVDACISDPVYGCRSPFSKEEPVAPILWPPHENT
jgi:hypothetical protein